MGLYKKITDNYIKLVRPQTTGLYNKALLYYVPFQELEENSFFFDYPFLKFSEICENKLSSLAVLIQDNLVYKSCFLKGFSSETSNTLTSSKDFWDGTISDYNWHTFSKEDLSPFYQLFSNKDKNDLNRLYIKKSIFNNEISYIYILNRSTSFNPLSYELLFSNILSLIIYFFRLKNNYILVEDLSSFNVYGMNVEYTIHYENLENEMKSFLHLQDFQKIIQFLTILVKNFLQEKLNCSVSRNKIVITKHEDISSNPIAIAKALEKEIKSHFLPENRDKLYVTVKTLEEY